MIFRSTDRGAVVTVGTFDGVHLGHQAVLTEIATRARRSSRRSLLVTFEPHPLEVVNPAAAPQRLTVGRERLEILAQCDLDRVAVLPFTRELASFPPEAFVALLRDRYRLEELVIGHDHGFGKGRAGDVSLLRHLGSELGFAVDVVEPVAIDRRPLSSTLIRRAVAGGDLETAARLLGRSYSITSTVAIGSGRGREIGFRTINLAHIDERKLLPPDGVYAVRVEWAGGRAGGMMHQGPRPTFGETVRSLEAHLFDVDADLYQAEVKLSWVARLRDIRTFADATALREQLELDRTAAVAALTGLGR